MFGENGLCIVRIEPTLQMSFSGSNHNNVGSSRQLNKQEHSVFVSFQYDGDFNDDDDDDDDDEHDMIN